MSENVSDSCSQWELPLELLDIENQPTPSHLEKSLGKELVDVILKTCTPLQKKLFGRDKPLKGPNEEKMWINPRDRLDGNGVRLTEQLSKTNCLQALTHRGILEMGKKIEDKLERQHEREVEDAVREAEELAAFESNLRIKFHVENERKKLNEDWQHKFDALKAQHEEERKNLIKIFEDSRNVYCENAEQQFREEVENSVAQAISDTKHEMSEKCAEAISEELENQHNLFEQSMAVTLRNHRENDRNRMEELRNQCLKAMDLQSHLMVCRHATELMHLLSVEKRSWEQKMSKLREEDEAQIDSLRTKLNALTSDLLREHQSKSIICALWRKFRASLDVVDTESLTGDERRIFDQIERIQRELIENFDDNSSRIFIIESDERCSRETKKCDDWIYRKENVSKNVSSVAVEWERQNSANTLADDAFMSSIFHQMSHADVSAVEPAAIPEIASSITEESRKDEERNAGETISALLVKIATQNTPLPSVDIVPMPKIDSLHIKDSREIITKRISISEPKSVEARHHLLGVVDSLEVLSRRNSANTETPLPSLNGDHHKCYPPSNSLNVPPYLQANSHPCTPLVRMSANDWKELEDSIDLSRPEERVSVHFESENNESNRGSRQGSILKRTSVDAGTTDVLNEHNAIYPVIQKCRKTLMNMKVESILQVLCADNADSPNESAQNL